MTDLKDNSTQIATLMQVYQQSDPRLYQAMSLITDFISDTIRMIQPIVKIVEEQLPAPKLLLPPDDFTYKLTPTTIRLSWSRPKITGSFIYELRRGANWDSAEFVLRTQSTLVDIIPTMGEETTYLVRTLDAEGNYSKLDSSTLVIVEPPNAVSIDGSVIDNNVLLKWTESQSSFEIDHYTIMKGPDEIGSVRGTFANFFETIAGEYLYSVTPVDIIGNVGLTAQVTLRVNQPPDYVLTDSRLSTLLGTKTDIKLVFDPTIGG